VQIYVNPVARKESSLRSGSTSPVPQESIMEYKPSLRRIEDVFVFCRREVAYVSAAATTSSLSEGPRYAT